MKNSFTILLLTILSLVFVGPGIYFPVLKSLHRYKMHAFIKQQPLHRFTRLEFSMEEAATIYLEDGKEFERAGQRYDIICLSKQGNKIIVYCINDRDEERIFAKEKGSKRKAKQLEIIKSLNHLVFSPSNSPELLSPPARLALSHKAIYIDHYQDFTPAIISPPPQDWSV